MTGYRLHPDAFADLDAIEDYIAERDSDAADRVITEMSRVSITISSASGAKWAA